MVRERELIKWKDGSRIQSRAGELTAREIARNVPYLGDWRKCSEAFGRILSGVAR